MCFEPWLELHLQKHQELLPKASESFRVTQSVECLHQGVHARVCQTQVTQKDSPEEARLLTQGGCQLQCLAAQSGTMRNGSDLEGTQ